MSNARPHGGQGINNNTFNVESRTRHLDERDSTQLDPRTRDIEARLNKLRLSDNPHYNLPSPFSGNGSLNHPPKTQNRSLAPGHTLKLNTTPEALSEHATNDYVNSKTSSLNTATMGPSDAVSPLSSPPYASAYSGQRSSGAQVNDQAAEMQARILALQRSRSKRTVPPQASSASSPQLSSLPRRSSSSSGTTGNNFSSNSIVGQLCQKGNSRTSVSTFDSLSAESEEDEVSSNSSPAFEKNESVFDLRSYPTPTNTEPMTLNTPLSRLSSPNTATTPQSTPIPKQPLASNGFDPNTVISPTAASFAASGAPVSLSRASSFRTRQRSSLSARRGMKLDPTALQCDDRTTGGNNSHPGSVSSSRSTSMSNSGNRPAGILANQVRNGRPGAPSNIPQESGNRGLFRDYRKYIDIETGSLNFAGKACVHAQGIEFSSGEKFNISIDKLQFISELGSGNYGTVQKVLHTPNGVVMAVKEIRLELDEASLRQIIMELDVLHRCDTSKIIAFYGAFFVEGSVYICMEYMDGGSINKIYEGGIEERYLKYVVHSVVQGLKQLKEQFNIIHRDVKPTNILCSTSGEVKLCDFGVSGNLVASIARTNIGCQAYMAPERIKVDRVTMGNPNQQMTYTAESDIWSLGLSIIEMSKGSYPYPSESFASIFSQLNAIVEDPSPALDPTRYSPEACDFVNKLLSKSPENRPKYADIVKHPWLANVECTKEEMGAFVSGKLAEQNGKSPKNSSEQPTVTFNNR